MRLRNVGLAIAGIVTAALAVTGCSETGSTSASTSAGGSAAATSCTKAPPSTVASPSAAASSAAASSAPAASSAESSAPAASGASAGLVEKGKGGTLTIGVKFDQLGLGLKGADGTMSGFDVEVAKYVAKKLGVEESGITWKETPSAQRETALQNQEVDFIVATYSITDKRKQVVDFAGPYFIAHQDLLVKSDNTSICGPNDLDGKLLCSVKGSTSAQRIKDTFSTDVQLKEYGGYSDCVQALKTGAVDAVTTDDVILAGYAAQSPNDYKVVGNGFSNENYGVGIHKGDTAGTAAASAALAEMISDGSWEKALKDTVGPSGYTIPAPPTPSAQG
jgi:glutamate transport system substrate-binding protein